MMNEGRLPATTILFSVLPTTKCACYCREMMYNRSSSNNLWWYGGVGAREWGWGGGCQTLANHSSLRMTLFQLFPVPSAPGDQCTLASQRRYLWTPPDRLPLPFPFAEVSHIQALPELLKAAVTEDDLARNRSVTWACWPVSQLLVLTWSPQAAAQSDADGTDTTFSPSLLLLAVYWEILRQYVY